MGPRRRGVTARPAHGFFIPYIFSLATMSTTYYIIKEAYILGHGHCHCIRCITVTLRTRHELRNNIQLHTMHSNGNMRTCYEKSQFSPPKNHLFKKRFSMSKCSKTHLQQCRNSKKISGSRFALAINLAAYGGSAVAIFQTNMFPAPPFQKSCIRP